MYFTFLERAKMPNDYKFLRTVDGISYFACVSVDVDVDSGSVKIVDAIGNNVDPEEGEFNANSAPSWVKAALAGASEAAEYLTNAGFVENGCIVRIVRLVGSVIDSREDVVACAAALATWQTLCPQLRLPEPVFEKGNWKVKYPQIGRHVSKTRARADETAAV
jgi:hypothetical protein